MNIMNFIERLNLLEDKLKAIEDHFNIDVVYEPGKLQVTPRLIQSLGSTLMTDNSTNRQIYGI